VTAAEALDQRDPVADFDRCRPFLQSALDRGGNTHTLEDIAAGVAAGTYHFWPGERSAAVTEVFQYPRARYLNVFLAGGDMDEILQMEPCFCSWGKHLGCSRIFLIGREGWGKVLKSQGWQTQFAVVSKTLQEPRE
jgi:hypothetical protein